MKAVAGIDGGGGGCRLHLLSLEGQPLARGEGGPANFRDVGLEGLAEALDASWRSACRALPEPPELAAAFLGLAGARAPEDQRRIRQRLGRLDWLPKGDRLTLAHDLLIAAHAAFDGQPGLVLAVGTGAACYGRDDQGRERFLGGWGPLLGDEGSGYWLGARALGAAARMDDGREPVTPLKERLLERLQADSLRDVLERLRQDQLPRPAIARLAETVLDQARAGDPAAQALLDQGAEELADLAQTALDQTRLARPQIALAGRLLQPDSPYRAALEKALSARRPQAALSDLARPPAEAAARIALQSLRPQAGEIGEEGRSPEA